MQPSFDHWNPALMQQLVEVREAYSEAFDTCWRTERMLRYVFWLRHQEHPGFNFTGSWRNDDIADEISLWQNIYRKDRTDQEAIDLIYKKFEDRFEMRISDALQIATSPSLAENGLPVWNNDIGGLIPQSMGSLRIAAANEYDGNPRGPGGVGYSFRARGEISSVSPILDIYFYDVYQEELGTGIEDPRLLSEFNRSWGDVLSITLPCTDAANELLIGVEILEGSYGGAFPFYAIGDCRKYQNEDTSKWTALSLTALCNKFMKVRLTVELDHCEDAATIECIESINRDTADFCCHFAPRGWAFDPAALQIGNPNTVPML